MGEPEDFNTLEGQIYRDEMMNCDVKVTSTDEIAVFIRDVELLDEEGENGGSPYPWPSWEENLESGRFHLIKDVPDRSDDDDDPVSEEEEEEGANEQDEEESSEEESEEPMSPDDFTHQEARSW